MSRREAIAATGMTLLAIVCLALTCVLMVFAATNLPWWCAWVPVVGWTSGLYVVGRLMWRDWRETWRS